MKTALINALIRAGRTFAQAFIPIYVAGLASATVVGDLANLDLLQQAGIAGVIAVLSFLMNVLESSAGWTYRRG